MKNALIAALVSLVVATASAGAATHSTTLSRLTSFAMPWPG